MSNAIFSAMGQQSSGSANSQGLASQALDLSGASKSNALSGLQSISTVGAMLSQLSAAREKKLSYFSAANDARIDASQQQVVGASRNVSLKDLLSQTLGQRDVAYAASGVDVGDGVAKTSREAIGEQAIRAGSLNDLSSDMQSRRKMIDAYRYEMAGKNAAQGGIVGVLGTLLNTAASVAKAG